MSDIVRNAEYPGIQVDHPDSAGASIGDGITRFHFDIETGANEETAVDDAIAAYPAFIQAQEEAAAEAALTKSEVEAMIATFNSGSAATAYFNALQAGLRTVVQNNTPIANFYPNMLNLLDDEDNPNLYQYFLNFCSIFGNLTQANVETPSTDAQRRQVGQLAVLFSVSGAFQVTASAPK